MFEGKGGQQAFAKGGAPAEKANELLVNAKDAIIESPRATSSRPWPRKSPLH